jgi:hypothetical protein
MRRDESGLYEVTCYYAKEGEMMIPQLPEPLPPELEEHLTCLLGQWANARRLSVVRARSIREAVQEDDAWEQSFWTRMSAVLTPAPAVIEHVLRMNSPISTIAIEIARGGSFKNVPGATTAGETKKASRVSKTQISSEAGIFR